VLLLVVLALLASVAPVLAAKPPNAGKPSHVDKSAKGEKPPKGRRGRIGQAGKSDVAFVELWEKDPETWEIVEDGAWGKLKYDIRGPTFDFHYNGHGLELDTDYSLIYYADPWPGDNPGALIAIGTTNHGGNLHLKGSIDLGMSLPHPDDANYEDPGGDPGTPGEPQQPFPFGGAKIWLVLSSDYDHVEERMVNWNPGEYLFEHALMTYEDTDG
jgi:hypothetical protein